MSQQTNINQSTNQSIKPNQNNPKSYPETCSYIYTKKKPLIIYTKICVYSSIHPLIYICYSIKQLFGIKEKYVNYFKNCYSDLVKPTLFSFFLLSLGIQYIKLPVMVRIFIVTTSVCILGHSLLELAPQALGLTVPIAIYGFDHFTPKLVYQSSGNFSLLPAFKC